MFSDVFDGVEEMILLPRDAKETKDATLEMLLAVGDEFVKKYSGKLGQWDYIISVNYGNLYQEVLSLIHI